MKLVKSTNGDMDMSGQAGAASKPKPTKTLTDFGDMGDLLSKIESKVEKKVNHEQRAATGKKEKMSAIDRDKERLEKIGNLSAF